MSDTLFLKNIDSIGTPFAIFGGAYSNFQATKALKNRLDEQGFTPDRIICTGDLVAYCGQPKETVDLVRSWGIHCIKGNVEVQLANDEENCGCDFVEGTVCDALSVKWYNYARQTLNQNDKQWLGSLPDHLKFSIDGTRFHVFHGGSRQINKFVFASTNAEEKLSDLEHVQCDVALCGHCGIPFVQKLPSNKTWVNAGVIGMPANDGMTNTWYCTIDKDRDEFKLAFHKLSYDFEKTVASMQTQGLPEDYQVSLKTGLWPSMDILPLAEQVLQGKSLSFEATSF